MRRSVALGAVLLAIALPGVAQDNSPRLHREIPGDTDFGDLPPGSIAHPASAAALQRTAAMTGWRDDQPPADPVLHPVEAWTPEVRTMDRDTRSPAGAALNYREVFTPSVAPFKRAMAYDAVDGLGRLAVRDPSLRAVPVPGVPVWDVRAPAARFTADVLVQLSVHTATPIPGVAGQQRVVSYRASPDTPLAFLTDSAGNLYVRAGVSRTVRLTYVLEAPEQAFVAPVLPGDPVGVPVPGIDTPTVPPEIARASETVLRAIGVHHGEPYNRVLPRMAEYFRGFRDAERTTPPTESLYTDLALGRVGACRHRAYAFVLTLHALGVPARYVSNEAHAWAEVAVPGTGWTRVDLGGWDVNLHADEPTPREHFVPENPDPYPRPVGYANGYSTLSNPHPGQPPPNAAPGPESPERPAGERSPMDEPRWDTAHAEDAHPQPRTTEHTGDPAATETHASEEQELQRVTLTLDPMTPEDSTATGSHGYVRGSMFRCAGEARDDAGLPVANLPVEVRLTAHGHPARSLGTTVTGPDGRFAPQVLLPFDLPVGAYTLGVRTAGDARHAPAATE